MEDFIEVLKGSAIFFVAVIVITAQVAGAIWISELFEGIWKDIVWMRVMVMFNVVNWLIIRFLNDRYGD
jgi:hypothetical protein